MSKQIDKPVLNEQALERLLEAAFVLQEHNRELQDLDLNLELRSSTLRKQETRPSQPPPAGAPSDSAKTDYTLTLGHIVETQRQIQSRNLDLDNATTLAAERIVEITKAPGAAIGTVAGKNIRYRTAAGSHALPPGTEVPVNKALCDACLRVGQVIRCHDVNTEFLVDVEECHRRGIQSLIAVPIYHNGEVAGALELYFARANAFTEQDVHSCQLMAGLVTEALARDDEIAWKKSLAAERATMLEALEKLKPNLAALVESAASKELTIQSTNTPGAKAVSAGSTICWKCGHQLVAEEQFCGQCGASRVQGDPGGMQSKVASLWQMQEAKRRGEPFTLSGSSEASIPTPAASPASNDTDSAEMLDGDLQAPARVDLNSNSIHTADGHTEELVRSLVEPESSDEAISEKESPNTVAAETALVKSDSAVTWSSAARARDFLEQLATGRDKSGAFARFWNSRRGDIYLAVAVVLVAVVIRWGIWSNHSVSATGTPAAAASHRRPDPNADLSLFDKLLISLGLAEAPEAPEYRGNPQTQVWVDTRTALYYCPGADLYGKTPKGKYTSQRDAQLDQFEPAYRKACD